MAELSFRELLGSLLNSFEAAEDSLQRRVNRKIYWHVVLPMFIVSVLAYIDRNNLSYAKLTMNSDLKFSETVYGFGVGVFFWGYVLFEIPGALIAERFSAKLWLVRIMISWGVLTGLMAWITTPWQFYTLRFLIGAAEASLYPVLYACIIPRWFAPNDRARAIAVMLASLQVSAIVGGPLAGWLIDQPVGSFRGWQVLYIAEAIPAIAFGLVLTLWLSERPELAKWLTAEEKAYLHQSLSNQATTALARKVTPLQALADGRVLLLCLIYFLWMSGYWGFNYYTPTILKEFQFTNIQVGLLMAFAMLLSMIVMLVVGHSSSLTGEKRWHGAIGLFLAAVGMYLGTSLTNAWTSYAMLCLAGIGVYSALGVWWSYPTTFLRGAAAAAAIGLINTAGSCGGFVGPYITGFLKDIQGTYAGAWAYLAACLLLAGLLILSLRKAD